MSAPAPSPATFVLAVDESPSASLVTVKAAEELASNETKLFLNTKVWLPPFWCAVLVYQAPVAVNQMLC